MLNRRLRRFGALLGLLAIWMTVLAPAISQTLAAREHAEHAQHETIAGSQCPDHAAAQMPVGGDSDRPSHGHDASGHGQACGYCAFFSHLPMVPALMPVFLPVPLAAAAPLAVALAEPEVCERFLAAQPRAPPFVS
jgi:hypothetical protein